MENKEEVFWISVEAVRKRYMEGLITKIEYFCIIQSLCIKGIAAESQDLYRDHWKLANIKKEVDKGDS